MFMILPTIKKRKSKCYKCIGKDSVLNIFPCLANQQIHQEKSLLSSGKSYLLSVFYNLFQLLPCLNFIFIFFLKALIHKSQTNGPLFAPINCFPLFFLNADSTFTSLQSHNATSIPKSFQVDH